MLLKLTICDGDVGQLMEAQSWSWVSGLCFPSVSFASLCVSNIACPSLLTPASHVSSVVDNSVSSFLLHALQVQLPGKSSPSPLPRCLCFCLLLAPGCRFYGYLQCLDRAKMLPGSLSWRVTGIEGVRVLILSSATLLCRGEHRLGWYLWECRCLFNF